jgi:catalase (peroxidase I)
MDKAARVSAPTQSRASAWTWSLLGRYFWNLAIEDTGGLIRGFIDGPSRKQDKSKHVEVIGTLALGQITIGKIYVHPEGPMGEPEPQGAADITRDVFRRIGMRGRENVALIGGGRAFRNCHGQDLKAKD